jgi:hypothetical protein
MVKDEREAVKGCLGYLSFWKNESSTLPVLIAMLPNSFATSVKVTSIAKKWPQRNL